MYLGLGPSSSQTLAESSQGRLSDGKGRRPSLGVSASQGTLDLWSFSRVRKPLRLHGGGPASAPRERVSRKSCISPRTRLSNGSLGHPWWTAGLFSWVSSDDQGPGRLCDPPKRIFQREGVASIVVYENEVAANADKMPGISWALLPNVYVTEIDGIE